jgi:hypothetical protein
MRRNQLVAVGFLTLMSGCAESRPTDRSPAKELAMHSTALPPLFIRPIQDRAPDLLASVTGKLVVEGLCVFIANEANRWLIIWPTGTKQEGATVTLPNGKQLRVGDTITLSGGARDGSANETFWGASVPRNCRGPLFVVNQQMK